VVGVVRRRVDQVDGVDDDRVESGGGERLPERREMLLGVVRGPPHPRRLIEDLDGVTAAFDAPLDGLLEPAGGGDVGADEHARSVEG